MQSADWLYGHKWQVTCVKATVSSEQQQAGVKSLSSSAARNIADLVVQHVAFHWRHKASAHVLSRPVSIERDAQERRMSSALMLCLHTVAQPRPLVQDSYHTDSVLF